MSAEPFPFLDLPPEIRLMVYERTPRTIKHVHVKIDYPPFPQADLSLTFVMRSMPMSILGTCKLVNSEARDIMSRLATDFVLKATPKVLCAMDPYCDLVDFLNLLFRMVSREDVSDHRSWLENKWPFPDSLFLLTEIVHAVPIFTSRYSRGEITDCPDIFLQDVLEQQNLKEGFLKWMQQSSLQGHHHFLSKTLYANQVVVKTPSLSAMEFLEALDFDDRNYYDSFRVRVLEVATFQVAGFQGGEEGDADQDQLPTYDDTTLTDYGYPHYRIRNNEKVFGPLEQATWEEEWLE